MFHQRPKVPAVNPLVLLQARCCFVKGAPQNGHTPVFQRMRQWHIGIQPAKPMLLQIERAKEWRHDRHRMNCGANIVSEAGKCEFLGASPAANRLCGFKDFYAPSAPGEVNSGSEAVWSGANDE